MADTRGRTRAAKKIAAQRMRESLRMEEEEVDFDPRYEDEVSRFNRFENTANETTADTSGHVSVDTTRTSIKSNQSQRIDTLENEVGQVKTKVDNIDTKLDLLLAAANPAKYSSTPRRAPAIPGPMKEAPNVKGKTHLTSDFFY